MLSDKTNELDTIKKLPPEEAIALLSAIVLKEPNNDEAFALRAQNLWKLNRQREAINDCLAALKINPASKAKVLLDYANSILGYYNKDLLNP